MNKFKIYMSALLIATLIFSVIYNSPTAFADNNVIVEIDGQRVNFPDQQPIIVNDRTLVPVRGVFERLGYTVGWEQAKKTVSLSNWISNVLIVIGESKFITNDKVYNLDVPAQIIKGRTMLPLRAILESVGCTLEWDSSRSVVLIHSNLPKIVDNSTLKYFPPIFNQGTVGACAEVGMGYYTLTYMTARARNIDVKALGERAIYSPGFWHGTNIGGLIPLRAGLVTLDKWPWDEDALNAPPRPAPPELWREAIQNRADNILIIGVFRDEADRESLPWAKEQLGDRYIFAMGEDIEAFHTLLKTYLADEYVFAMSTQISGWIPHKISDNPYSTLDDTEIGKQIFTYDPSLCFGDGHVITLVGYNDDIWLDRNNNGIIDEGELGAYKFANSWGTEWGNDGFMWLSYADASLPMWGKIETYIVNKERHIPLLLAELELESPGFYFLGELGWAPHNSPDRITFLESDTIGHLLFSGGCTIIADFSSIISENNLDLDKAKYDWYLRLNLILPLTTTRRY